MTKHTKGPWSYSREGGTWFIHGNAEIYPSGMPVVATLHDKSNRLAFNEDTVDANCRLIQAAPDMLATLRAIANDCEDYLNDDLDMDAGDLCQAFLAAINKVHDKATGSTFDSVNPVDEHGEKV